MVVNFTEEQEMLRASARDFLEKECTDNVISEIEASGLGHSPDLWQKIADLGWLGLVYPEQYGGGGMNLIDLAVLFEEFGRAMFPSPYLSTIVLSGLTVFEAGNEKQKSDILTRIIRGDLIVAPVIEQPDTSWEGAAWKPEDVTISAFADGNDYQLNGVRLFVHDANIASTLLVPAKMKAGSNTEYVITLFLVDTGSPGIIVTRLATFTGDNQCEVIFNKVSVPSENIVGELHDGWAPLNRSMQIGSVMLSAQMLGAGQRLLELSVEDHENRAQFDMATEPNQYTEEHLAHLLNDVEGCRWTTYLAARKLAERKIDDLKITVVEDWSSYSQKNA